MTVSFAEKFAEKARTKRVISRTTEFERIAALPMRKTFEDYAEVFTEYFKKAAGEWTIRREQAWAMLEMSRVGGLLGGLEVGAGKTLITLLAPEVMELERPMLLVPAGLKTKTLREMKEYAQHFRIYPFDEDSIMSYEQLSQAGRMDALDKRQPDGVICDEAHKLKNKKAGVTRRVLRYGDSRPNTKWVFLTGSLTSTSLRDYAHLARLALKDGSPLPNRYMDLEDWADLIDVNVDKAIRPDPGAMLDFCAPGESARTGFKNRLIFTSGVVNTPSPAVDIPIEIKQVEVKIPEKITETFRTFRDDWLLPSGEVAGTALDFFRHANELTLGFYNRWVWPNDEPDLEWIDSKKSWKRFVAETIGDSGSKRLGRMLFDTELQVWNACKKGQIQCPDKQFDSWAIMRKKPEPKTEPVWLSEFMVDYAINWMSAGKPGIVWTHNNPFLDRLRARGVPCYGAGQNEVEEERSSCVASLQAHGTGKNLQKFHHRMLYLAIPTSGVQWEQSIGRLHRPGLKASILQVDVVLSCYEQWNSLVKAREGALYIEETTGMQQKLNLAKVDVLKADEIIKRSKALDPMWDQKGK